MIETKEKIDKRFVHCPVCGKWLMKISGTAEIELKCDKCGSDIIAKIKNEMISISGNRRDKLSKRQGAVSVSIQKGPGM